MEGRGKEVINYVHDEYVETVTLKYALYVTHGARWRLLG